MATGLDPREEPFRLATPEPTASSFSGEGARAPAVPPSPLAPGDVIAERYRVEKPLARGGMGEVFVGRDIRLDRRVAIKVLTTSSGETSARRLEQEARVAAGLQHVNVVVVHDVGVHGGFPFIVAELLEGETLRTRLARGPIALEQALECAVQIARGLKAAHQASIVHRDLKPENVFIVESGAVKLVDFGLAKFVPPSDATLEPTASGESLTSTGQVIGTAGYMSPEQLRSEPIDARSDIFSFGAVLFEMLAGQRAFPGETAVARAYAILHRDPPALSDVSLPVAALVSRCLHRDAAQRFNDGEGLLRALEELRPRARREWPRRSGSSRWMLPAASALLIAAGAALLVMRLRRPVPAPLPVAIAQLVELARAETSSPVALQAFESGELALRDGDRPAALEQFRKAVARDKEFVLAQYGAAFSSSTEEPGLADDAIRFAVAGAGVGHDRERLLASGFLAMMEGRDADTIFDRLLALDPGNVEAQVERGDFFFHFDPLRGGDFSRAAAAFSHALLFDPEEPTALGHLLDLAEQNGQRALAALLAQRLLRLQSGRGSPSLRWTLAWARGDPDARAASRQELRAPSTSMVELTDAWLRARWEDADLSGADEIARILAARAAPHERSQGLVMLALAGMARGQPVAALADMDEARRIDPRAVRIYEAAWMVSLAPGVERERRLSARADLQHLDATADPMLGPLALQREGLLALQDGDLAAADARADQLEHMPLFENSTVTTDLAQGLRAQLALARADPAAAQMFLDKMELRIPYRYTRWLVRISQQTTRAQLALDAGHAQAAQPWLLLAFHGPYETPFVGPVLSQRSRVAELTGDRDGAIRDLRRLTELYAHCEPPFLAQLQDARSRLSALEGGAVKGHPEMPPK